MLFEDTLRKLSVGQRMTAIIVLLMLPMAVLSMVSVVLLNDQEITFRDSVEESIQTLLPLTSLEHYLEWALVDELEAQSGESVPDFAGLTSNIDRTFTTVENSDRRDDVSWHRLQSAQQAWDQARPAVDRLIERASSLQPHDSRLGKNLTQQQLRQSIHDIHVAREQLARLVEVRYTRAMATRHSQLRWLVWSWAITLSVAALLLAAFLHSLLSPIKALGRAARSLGSGETGVRLPVSGNDELTTLSERFNDMADHWESTRHSLLIEAAEDPLTGALNRRGILASLDGVLLSHVRQQQPISVFMIDLDRFKVINDKFGHSAGDRALTWVTSKMREMLRSGDLLGRYGGDEFLMILPGTTKIQAQQIAQRMAQSIHEVASREAAYPTISIGIGSAPEDGRDATSLIEAADTALYGAKDRRRNDAAPGNPNAA
ncbi:MAG: diguanylate cyclase [Rhodanobacter sp.]|nr:MAG: diguanylate cyclase [Rhodanobacter sp.]